MTAVHAARYCAGPRGNIPGSGLCDQRVQLSKDGGIVAPTCGNIQLLVSKPGSATSGCGFQQMNESKPLEIRLQRQSGFAGLVFDRAGQPAPDAQVDLSFAPPALPNLTPGTATANQS